MDSPRDKSPLRHLAYRPDVDGLRALAVVAVIAYHAGIAHVPGGFVGVDIFFVISGYLIGSQVIGQAQRAEFSILRFYVRRIRRIIPALVAMIATTIALGYFFLFPSEYRTLASSALSAALSASNFYFLQHSGYFDPLAGAQPLLHTWSLGVEEQFYIFFPLIVLAIFRFRPRSLNIVLGSIWIISFVTSAYGVFAAPVATFYLAPTRAWELLSGVLIATLPTPKKLSISTLNFLGAIGLLMIVVPVFAYDYELPFPGVTALLPCLGTVFVIVAGQSRSCLVTRLLSVKPLVFVGLISYSWYLWHWPIFFFQRQDSVLISTTAPRMVKLVEILISFFVAVLSWRFIERPFRRGRAGTPNSKVFGFGLGASGSLVALSLVIIAAGGLPHRFSPQALHYASYLDSGQRFFRSGSCFIVSPYTYADFNPEKCLQEKSGEENYLLIGDSHAAMLWYGLSRVLRSVNILQATAAGCVPVPVQPIWISSSCRELMKYMFTRFLVQHRVDRLLMVARWTPRDLPALQAVLAWAKRRAIPVTVFGPMVEYNLPLPRLLAKGAENGNPLYAQSHIDWAGKELDDELKSLVTGGDDQYISLFNVLCHGDYCSDVTAGDVPVEFDRDHVTKGGSLLIARAVTADFPPGEAAAVPDADRIPVREAGQDRARRSEP